MYLCVRVTEVPVSSQESEQVMYLCVRVTEVPVSSQEREQSCICVLGLLNCLYQARKVSSHVFVC